jgi:hypothetical protein
MVFSDQPSRRFTVTHLIVLVAVIALVIAFIIPLTKRTNDSANLALCKDHLRQIGVGLIQYARVGNGDLPVSDTIDGPDPKLIQLLVASHCAGDMKNYYCPAEHDQTLSFSEQHFRSGIIGYYYYSALSSGQNHDLSKFLRSGVSWPRKLSSKMDPLTWLMSDIWVSGVPTAHLGYKKGVNFLKLDGSVDFIGDSPRHAFH